MVSQILVSINQQGLHDITRQVVAVVNKAQLREGLCTLYIQHTSASLLIQENYDPSARDDLENWLNRLVPENDALYTHTLEGADDMPAHIKASLTATSLSIPINQGELMLGTWQGIYLWEHRVGPQNRTVIIHLMESQ